jgi:hypothetical protein
MPKFVSLDLKDTRWTVRSEVSAFLTPHFLGSLLGVERSEEVPRRFLPQDAYPAEPQSAFPQEEPIFLPSM